MEDELISFVDNPVRRRGRPRKTPMRSPEDEGIGSSIDSLNDSIAHSVKRRKRVSNDTQFDAKYFLDSVVDRIENKYKHNKEDPIIDLNNLEIINEKDIGFVAKNVRKEFGYFAENTLEDLRQNSFRDKRLINYSLVATTPSSVKGDRRLTKSERRPKNARTETNARTAMYSDSRALQPRSFGQLVAQRKPAMTQIAVASDSESVTSDSGNSVKSNQSIELDDYHPLMVYENRKMWTDNDFQTNCLKECIANLKADKSHRLRDALKKRALETLNLGGLPQSPSLCPIIRFNANGEPNFEFHFMAANSPLSAGESLKIDAEIIFLSKTIYEVINFDESHYSNRRPKRLSFPTKRRIDFQYY